MLTISSIIVILSNAFTNRKDLGIKFNRNIVAIFTIGIIISLNSNFTLKEGVSLFGGLFHNTSLTIVFHIFLIFISLIILQLTAFFPRKYNERSDSDPFLKNLIHYLHLTSKIKEQYTIIEYPLIILFIIIGGMLLISSSDIVSIFLSIELQSYGLYLLCALYRNSEWSTGASLTYFLLGGLSSCFILLASAILYTNSGTSNLDSYYMLLNLSDAKDIIFNMVHWYSNNYINYSLVILSIGFLFKISAAPFHFWSPDVYDAIPTVVTTFVANVAKISILIFLVEIVHNAGNLSVFNFSWTNCLLLSSFLSLIIGTVLGLNQSRIKRLMAYSTISHLGFILLAISVNSLESIQAFVFYLMQYSLSNINAFILIISIGYTLFMYSKKKETSMIDQDNSPIQYIAQLKGYYHINPVIAISLTIVIYSFVGIPPLIGFFGKQMVLSAALDKGYIFLSLVAIITSVISAVYYLNVIKEIFFSKSDYILNKFGKKIEKDTEITTQGMTLSVLNTRDYTIVLSTNLTVVTSTLTLIMLLFMLNPEEWLSIANILAMTISN